MTLSKRYHCSDCGSSDGLAVYEDHTYCFACNTRHESYISNNLSVKSVYNSANDIEKVFDITNLKTLPITDRGISAKTVEFYGIGVLLGSVGQPVEHHYPVFNTAENPEQIGEFIRVLPKSFITRVPDGLANASLFGANKFPSGCAKYITVTEGHLDAAAAFEILDSKWPVVSVHAGAGNALKEFIHNLEYLESFERVYICFDRDKVGQEAAIACARKLAPGKARIVRMDPTLKDPCGYKVAHKAEEFARAWWNAEIYTPAGILTGSAVAERLKTKEFKPSVPYPFDGLNKLTYGIRTGEAVVIQAPTGVGKTSFLREIEKTILAHNKDVKIGTLFLEETPEDSGLGLMSVHADVPFHLPDAEYTDEQYEAAERILREDRVYFFDSFGSNKIDEIIARIRYYAKGLGCRYIILDHLSIIVSDQLNGDERKLLDSLMTQLKTLTIELDVALIAVVHQNRQGQIRGTAGIEQLANIVIDLERDIMADDPIVRRTVKVGVKKNRFSGRTGPACLCRYDEDTGRTTEILDETFTPSTKDVMEVFGDDTTFVP